MASCRRSGASLPLQHPRVMALALGAADARARRGVLEQRRAAQDVILTAASGTQAGFTPRPVLAEIVQNPLPRERARNDVHKHPYYYAVRNHIFDFLVSRSRGFIAPDAMSSSARRFLRTQP